MSSELVALSAAADRVAALEAQLRQAGAERDRLIVVAREAGIGYREITAASRLTKGRVFQIWRDGR